MRLAVIASLTVHAAALAALTTLDLRPTVEPPPSITVRLLALPAPADPVPVPEPLAAAPPAAAVAVPALPDLAPPVGEPAVAAPTSGPAPEVAAAVAGPEPPLPAKRKPHGPAKPPQPASLAALAPAAGNPAPAEAVPAAEAASTVAAVAPAAPLVERGPSLLPGNPLPGYPAAARRRALQGRAVVRAAIDADGTVAAVELLRSSSHALLDQAALDAVRHWRFAPARHGAATVSAAIDIPVVFRLED